MANAVVPLERFNAARQEARKFHAQTIGADVNTRKCFADFLWRIYNRDAAGLETVYKTAMVSTSGAVGGYTVPAELNYELMQDVAEEALIRPRADVQPMTSATLDLSLPDATIVPSSSAISPFYAGMQMKWTEEGTARSETEPKWRRLTLRAWELSGYALISNTMAADGGSPLETRLRKLFARSIAWYEDYAFLQGTGVGQPLGMVVAPGTKTVTRNTGSHFVAADMGAMAKALLPYSYNRGIWLISPSVWGDLPGFTGGYWQANQPMPRDGDNGPRFVLNSQPGFTTEKLPALGTKGDVLLIDPSLYIIGDRQAVDIQFSRDEPTAFLNNQSVWRIVHRVDGQPAFPSTITLQDTSTTVSPHVVLV